jgi:glycogenin glucosyltransferase
MTKDILQNKSNYAYGTFIFKDGGYLPGLLLIAHKLRENSNKEIKLICWHTNDIDKYVLDIISEVYDIVQPVEYLRFGKNRVGRQSPLPYMFTRFRCLQLVKPYFNHQIDKILVLDADMLPLATFDNLFELDAPAGVINENKSNMNGGLTTTEHVEKWEWHSTYEPACEHGNTIPKEITDRPLLQPELNMGINGGLMLLKPSESSFKAFSAWCQQPENEAAINKMPWPDMQAITAFYSGEWTSIDAKYLGLYGYPNIQSLNGVHFIGPKPWQWKAKGFAYRLNKYPDYRLWAKEYLAMCTKRPELLKHKQLLALKQNIETLLL